MRIARFSWVGRDTWGVLHDDHSIRSGPPGLDLVDALCEMSLLQGDVELGQPIPLSEVRVLAPINNPPQFLGVGANYRDHIEEVGGEAPRSPVTFGLLRSAIVGPNDPIEIPGFTDVVDWEAELAIVIGKGGRDIPIGRALEAVAGYTIVNDVSARDVQMAEGQWGRAKSFDTFKPMGPWIVGTDELGDASGLAMSLSVNGVTKQTSNTSQLIFGVPFLVSHLSQHTTLLPGTVIATGTPAGIGMMRTPPEYLRDGDVVRIEIEGIGTLTNLVSQLALVR